MARGVTAGTETGKEIRTAAKDALLETVLAYLTEHGVRDLSLRGLAAAIGTSHRMLIYHFGSKEGLLVEIVKTMEARQRTVLADLEADPELSPRDGARRFWRHLTDPELWPFERLFFELYGQALQHRPGTTALLDGVVDTWLAPLAEAVRRRGVPADEATAEARLGLAVARGLLLDLLATGDLDAVNAAMERFIATLPGSAG